LATGLKEIDVKKKADIHKIAWGITGGGDRLGETINIMKKLKKTYASEIDIRVFLSKAGEQVAKWYRLYEPLKNSFDKLLVEIGPNTPFLAGELQNRKFEFLLIAPATSNTVAKIATGICDTLLSNSAIMAAKAFIPVYIMPTDLREEEIVTKLPDGKNLRLRVRREDAENTRRLAAMDGFMLLKSPENIRGLFEERFGHKL
jgi:archaeoflavoprotein AfpA